MTAKCPQNRVIFVVSILHLNMVHFLAVRLSFYFSKVKKAKAKLNAVTAGHCDSPATIQIVC